MQLLRLGAFSDGCYSIRRQWFCGCLIVLMLLVTVVSSQAQTDSVKVPKRDYFLSFGFLYDGDFERGARAFRSAARSGIRSTEGRWIDSICYATMMGECMYRMGQLNLALEQYEIALKLFLVHQNWMRQVDFPAVIEPSRRTLRYPITWGTSRRQTLMGHVPDTVSITQGMFRTLQIGKQTGVVAGQQLFPIHAKEIARCTALALRRRREIMGPVCKYSALTIQLQDALGRRPALPNHWTQSWIDLQLGIVLASVGKEKEALAMLQRSLLMSGRFDHELTSIALLELGNLALEQNKYDEAGAFFLEASISAGVFEQYDIVEEALRWGLKSHLAGGKQGLYAPLPLAAQWARTTSRMLEAALYVAAAENYSVIGNVADANLNVQRAQQAMRRREMGRGNLGARVFYTSALLQFQQGNLVAGQKLLAQALAHQQKASPRLLQLRLADAIGVAGATTDGVASQLYAATLKDPTEKDWLLQPCDALNYLMTPHELQLQHWFQILLNRKEPEKAFEVVDQIRRHRFTSSLDLGGRLQALRWTMEAPQDALSDAVWAQRKVLEGKYPKFLAHSIDARAIRGKLRELPLIPEEDDAGRDQMELLKRLHELSGLQEVMLHEMALKPHVTEATFLPVCDINDLQENLAPDELVLSFYVMPKGIHVFALRKTHFDHWVINSSGKVQAELKNALRETGNIERDAPVDFNTLIGESWKEPMTELSEHLFQEAPGNLWAGVKRLTIVPDGFLWYLPFETLQIDGRLLFAKYPIRYVPTLSLACGDSRKTKLPERTAVLETELIAGEPEETGIEGVAQLKKRIAGLTQLPVPHVVPGNLLVANCNRLIVMSDVIGRGRGPYQWVPIVKDRAKKGDTLASWFMLPWASCDQVMLPAFHTSAEDSMRRGGNGNEVFFSVCGLLATGTRTVLISRWRTGSPLTYPLIGEFSDRLSKQTPDQAWQDTVKWFSRLPLDPLKEPRVKNPQAAIPVTAQHPFFWAGYMVIDTQRDKPVVAAGAANP